MPRRKWQGNICMRACEIIRERKKNFCIKKNPQGRKFSNLFSRTRVQKKYFSQWACFAGIVKVMEFLFSGLVDRQDFGERIRDCVKSPLSECDENIFIGILPPPREIVQKGKDEPESFDRKHERTAGSPCG